MQPIVSVLIPSFNHEQYIEKTLESLLKQSFKNIELIIIDDGSTDKSVEMIGKFQDVLNKRCIRFTFLVQENKGICYTFNKGLRMSTGKYFCILPSDDLMINDFLSKQVNYLEKNDKYACSYTNGYHIGDKSIEIQDYESAIKFSDRMEFRKGNLREFMLSNAFKMPTPSFMYKRAVLDELGGFDEQLTFEDTDMFLRISQDYEIGCINENLFFHRIHSYNSGRNIDILITGINTLIRKYEHSDYSVNEKKKLQNYLKETLNKIIEDAKNRKIKDVNIIEINKLSYGKKLIGWGTGSFADNFIHINKSLEFSYFIDSFKAGKGFNDYKVFKPERLLEEKKEDIFIVILSTFFIEIGDWLVEHEFIEKTHYY